MTQYTHNLLFISGYLINLMDMLKIVRTSMEFICKFKNILLYLNYLTCLKNSSNRQIYITNSSMILCYFILCQKIINFKFVNFYKMQKQKQKKTLEDVSGLALSLGMCKSMFQGNNTTISHMPVSLYPYIMKASIYNSLKHAHLIWQKLFIKIANDKSFVINLAQVFCKNDPYMSRILEIYKNHTNKNEKNLSKVACARVDYMGDSRPLLVQYNLMSVGLNGMSDRVQTLHKILNHHQYPSGKYTYPDNHNQETICKALVNSLKQSQLLEGIIVMVVHQKQFNYGDHFAFRMQMIKRGRRVQPITMANLIQNMKFHEQSQTASLEGKNIDAFYFRTGYSLDHFPTQKHWQVRYKIQRSRSIKLPSVDMILINSKRFQSELSKKNVLQKFLPIEEAQLLSNISGQIYDFDNKTDSQIQQLIQKTTKGDYVLKPNREGGGNNFFCQKAHKKLAQLYQEKTHLQNYILMKKINTQSHQNYFVFQHKSSFVSRATAQFSTLGCFIYRQGKTIMNEYGGTLVRLKRQEVNEGGIAINQGVLSGVCIQNFDDS